MATTTAVSNYKIYCTTENIYVSGWGVVSPTTCYHNNTHTVNPNSVQIIDTISSNTFSVKEDKIEVSRNTTVYSISILDIAPGETKSVTYTFPIPVSLYSFIITPDATNKGDIYSIIAAENTTLGLIVADLAINDTSLIAPTAFLLYATVGYHVSITDGTNTQDLGLVLTKDMETGVITFQNPIQYIFLASNTLIRMTIKVLNQIRIGGAGVYKFFDDVIGGAPIPAATIAKFTYTNNSIAGDNKELTVYLSCLY